MSDRAAPYVLAQGQIRSHPGAFPTIKAGAADTGGLLTVDEGVIGPGTPGPPLHIHERQDECLFVIEGHLLVQVGGPGSFAWMPRQVPHSYANVSGSPVHVIGIVVPGGLEEFFAEQSAYFAQLQGPPDPAKISAIAARYDSRPVGPPISTDARSRT